MNNCVSPRSRISAQWIAVAFAVCMCFGSCKRDTDRTTSPDTQTPGIRFEQQPASHTGIDFNNALIDTGNLNVFVWNFLYTGSGVATGDINNDGFPDIYLGGNQVRDRLYLNKGDFRFEDITEEAGIPDDKRWTTGVTMADVNADGLLDIYVCKNSPTINRNANRNRLFINKGKNQFVDEAVAYGVADEGLSIQSTFFDADQDGDIDMFLVNQPFDQLARMIHPAEAVHAYPVTDRFFRNDDGHFTDVTTEMGFQDDRYGLGISLGDYDGNGWTDVYVCNDYGQADFLYMNRNGVFRDEINDRTGHISFYSMGSDAGDVNNDGWEDVFVLDMAFEDHYRAKTNMESMQPEVFQEIVDHGHQYPYAQNTMQLNRGEGYFAETAQMGGLSKTDWSWATVFADLDQDGYQDILVTNGILRDMKNNDFSQWLKKEYQGRVGPSNYKEVLRHLPSNAVLNKVFRNMDGLRYRDVSKDAGFGEAGFSHGLAYADFDGDGALDVVVNNMNAPAGVFRNSSMRGHSFTLTLEGPGKNTHGLGIPVILCADGKCSARTMQTTRGYYSSSVPELHFGIGNATTVDSVVIYWNAGEMTVLKDLSVDQTLLVRYREAMIVPARIRPSKNIKLSLSHETSWSHKEIPFDDYRTQVLLPFKQSQNGPFLASGDVNGDGRSDMWIGGGAGQASQLLMLEANGTYTSFSQPAFAADAAAEKMEGKFFDLEGDGDLDLLVVHGSNEFNDEDPLLAPRIYINDGKGQFTTAKNVLPADLLINGQCVELLDADGDKDMDVFFGGRMVSGMYPLPASSVLLFNENGKLVDRTTEVAPSLEEFGMVTDAVVVDLEKDGDDDLFIVGEWMAPVVLVNQDASFTPRRLEAPGAGFWWTVEKGDMDQDGDEDFLLGNLGWNNKFGGEHPKLAVYAADFDQSGDNDVVLAKQSGDQELPYRGRECSSEEMPFIAQKFPTYDAFASAELSEILGKDRLKESMHQKMKTFSSTFLRNDGNLTFSAIDLPDRVQTGPVKAILIHDFNRDGNPDFMYAGNYFPVEVETARFDGLMHGICFGDGKGGFSAQTMHCPEKPLKGDYRDLILSADGKSIWFSQNNGAAVEYIIHAGNNDLPEAF